MKERLRAQGIDTGFEDEDENDDELQSGDDDEIDDRDGIDDMFEAQVPTVQ